MNRLLIDFDSILFSAASAKIEDDPDRFERDEQRVVDKMHKSLDWILYDLSEKGFEVDSYKLFVASEFNIRKVIYPEYKQNRKKEKPPLLGFARDYAIKELDAFSCNGVEAEDALHAAKIALEKDFDNNVVVAYIDSDVPQFEGMYYNYHYQKKDEDRLHYVSQEEAVQRFWSKMLCGDSKDNIHVKKGVGVKTAEKILKGQSTHFKAMRAVYAKYLEWFKKDAKLKFIITYRLLRAVTYGVPVPKSYTPNF